MNRHIWGCMVLMITLTAGATSQAGAWSKALREGAEFLSKKLGKQAVRHGDDAAKAGRALLRHPGVALTPAAPGIGRNIDEVGDALWRNRKGIAVGAGTAALVANSERIVEAGERTAAPIATATGHAIEETGHALAWPLALLAFLGGLAVIGSWIAHAREARKGRYS